MKLTETIASTPLAPQRSVRREEIRAITSAMPGTIVPLAYLPLLREDRLSRGSVQVSLEMMETAETLMNGINVKVMAHFIPFLAFERFNGLDQLNRSYKGIPETDGGTVVPFFETIAYDKDADLFRVMGIHAPTGSSVNSAVVEAYNVLVNHRRAARSTKLPLRLMDDTTLAAGFWANPGMRHIVPDFDQAMIDGEVELALATTQLPVKSNTALTGSNQSVNIDAVTGVASIHNAPIVGADALFAELGQQGVTLSLQNIEMAKKTAAFAALRKTYAGHDDEFIIDLLMEAIRVPDAQMAQPILLDQQSTMVGYSKRFAMDSGNLDKSVTTGATGVRLTMRTPPMNTGGIVLITAEICPEQLYERQKDHFLFLSGVDDLPSYTRDFLDPEKVDIVTNDHVDVNHTVPGGTFGYAPLNHVWQRSIPRIGGKFMRQPLDPFDENRQRIWSVETVDPSLTEDFYLVGTLHTNVFADTLSDPFEITTLGMAEIVGNTVFGKNLQENTSDYSTLSAQVDTSRIVQA